MGKIKVYPPVKYFVALTFRPTAELPEIYDLLKKIFSDIDSDSPVYFFDEFTAYYQKEMGAGLKKQIVSFLELKPAEILPDLKTATNEIEIKKSNHIGRLVNIDPGYLSAAKMVLATTKNYDHRLYLGRGIFGDVHLKFQNGQFRANSWTYPDYRQEKILTYFSELRQMYLNQLKQWTLQNGTI